MRRIGLAMAVSAFTAMTAGAWAEEADSQADKAEFRPYFGGVYEQGWMEFKTSNRYGKNITGYAPVVGVTMGKYFAFEASYRMAYGTGDSLDGTLPDVVTDTLRISTSTVTSYHISSRSFALDLLVRYPLGNTGLAPFFLTGVSIGRPKAGMQTDTTITTHPLSATDTSRDVVTHTSEYTVLQGKMEVSPEIGLGLAYSYGGAELRVLGRVQNLNMGNSGKYMLTLSGGLVVNI